jgi:chromosome segregation ATPase/DNA-directed RNA polymerase subunit M/transcription elongation factor TFIIS
MMSLSRISIHFGAHPMSEPQSHFVTSCPNCSTALKVRRQYLGQRVACKQCGHSFLGTAQDEPIAVDSGEQPTKLSAEPSQTSERVPVVCDHCKAALSVKSSRIGQVIRCKQCDRDFLAKPVLATQRAPDRTLGASTSLEDLLTLAVGREHGEGKHESVGPSGEHLQAELEKLGTAHALLETERQRLESAHSQLTAEIVRLSEQLERLPVDLDARRASEGWLSPIDARSLEQKAESLGAEVERLRDEARDLRVELAQRERLAESVEQRTSDLDSMRAERDSLAEMFKQRERDLDAARAKSSRAEEAMRGAVADLEQHHAAKARDLTQLQAEIAGLRQELDTERQNHEAERSQTSAALDRLASLQAEIDGLRAELERQRQHYQAERGRTSAELDRLTPLATEIEGLREELESARQNHEAELGRRSTLLDDSNEECRRLRERLEAADQLGTELKDSNEQLVQARSRMEAEHQITLDSRHARIAALEEEIGALRVELSSALETLSSSAELEQFSPARAAADPNPENGAEPPSAENLALKHRVAELEFLHQQMTAALDGLGIRLHLN